MRSSAMTGDIPEGVFRIAWDDNGYIKWPPTRSTLATFVELTSCSTSAHRFCTEKTLSGLGFVGDRPLKFLGRDTMIWLREQDRVMARGA